MFLKNNCKVCSDLYVTQISNDQVFDLAKGKEDPADILKGYPESAIRVIKYGVCPDCHEKVKKLGQTIKG